MPLKIDNKFLNKLCCRITIRLGKAVKYGEIQLYELHEACTYILVSFETLKTGNDVISMINRLTYRWPFFEDLVEKYYPQFSPITNGSIDKLNLLSYDDNICQLSSMKPTKTKSVAGSLSALEKQSKIKNSRNQNYRKSVPMS